MYAALIACVLGYFLVGIPVQLTDSLANLLKIQDLTLGQVWYDELRQGAYLRPLLWVETKLVFDASAGDYFTWFRGVHLIQLVLLVFLFVALLRPRRAADVAAVTVGLAVLVGLHTFAGTIEEAFPINSFLTILIFCLATAAIALHEHRWWSDVLAALLLVVAALTLESGLLVAVVAITAVLVRAPGISRRGAALQLAILAGYFVLRYTMLDVGSPSLSERASGFGFAVLEPSELQARFADNPWPFYLYNIASSALSVLFSEPRAGTWRLTGGLVAGEPNPAMVVNVAASILATALIAYIVWVRRSAWMTGAWTRDEQIIALFIAVLGANAVLSFSYTKDVIMSPAGAFYAAAVAVSVRLLVERTSTRRVSSWAVAALVGMTAVAWTVRDVGAHANLRQFAFNVRNEWAYVDEWIEANEGALDRPQAMTLLRALRESAVREHPAPPSLFPSADWTAILDLD
jgi:hypothetical protein